MSIPPNIFKSYDIRGLYPHEINEENIGTIIGAIYSLFLDRLKKPKLSIVLGRDMRLSSPILFEKAKKTLMSYGAEIIDVGLVSTPSLYFSVFHYKFDAGIQISASHNPKDYNGIKTVLRGEKGLIKVGKSTGMEEIKKRAIEGLLPDETHNGSLHRKKDVLVDEVANAFKIVGSVRINPFKIVADAANAMGSLYIEALFKELPCNLIKMNFELDGSFPAHQPDPLQSDTLVELQKKVVSEKADLGIAPDGDGDRLFFIDEKGDIVPPSMITAIVAREFLIKYPGDKILFDIRYTLTPSKIVDELGGKYEITKVGHAFITERMNESGGVFAGESSGHYYFRDTGNAESQLPVILSVLNVMSSENKKLSELVEEVRRSYESGEVNFEVPNAFEILEKVKKKYSDGKLSELDGIAISYPNFRFSIRISNTEPLLRLNVEGFEKKVMEENKDNLIQLIKSISEK